MGLSSDKVFIEPYRHVAQKYMKAYIKYLCFLLSDYSISSKYFLVSKTYFSWIASRISLSEAFSIPSASAASSRFVLSSMNSACSVSIVTKSRQSCLNSSLNSSFEASTSATRSIKSRISSFKEPPPFSLRSSKASCALLMASLYSFSASCNRYENQCELNLSPYLLLILTNDETCHPRPQLSPTSLTKMEYFDDI